MQHNTIQLAVIDMAGTTVADDGLVVEAFEAAATAAGLPDEGPDRERARRYVLDTMGQSKITVFRALFDDEALAQRANAVFEEAYAALIGAGRAGLFTNLVPIFGAALAVIVLGERFQLYHAVGLFLVLGGIALAEVSSRRIPLTPPV